MPLGRDEDEDSFDTVEDFLDNWRPILPDYTYSDEPLLQEYAWRTDQAIKSVHETPRFRCRHFFKTTKSSNDFPARGR